MKAKLWLRLERDQGLGSEAWVWAGYRSTPQMNSIIYGASNDWKAYDLGSIKLMSWRGKASVLYLEDTLMKELPPDPYA